MKHFAIIGAGNGGQAFAGYLSLRGAKVTIYDKFQNTVDALNEKGGVFVQGNSRYTGFGKIEFADTDIGRVVEGADVIFVTLPSIYHDDMAILLAEHLQDDQIVILNPIAPLGVIAFKQILEEKGCHARIKLAATSTLLFACRLKENGIVNINGQKQNVSIAAYPAVHNDSVCTETNEYFPEFNFVSDILVVSFENLNFEFHPGPVMLYTAMIEKGMDFSYYLDFVPSQVKIIEAVDRERLAICDAYGVPAISAEEVFRDMYGYEGDLHQMVTNAECYRGIKGPKTLESRYLCEDVPYALKSVQILAKIAKIPTPSIDTVVNLAYILLGDKLEEGRTMTSFGFTEDMTIADVLKKCNEE